MYCHINEYAKKCGLNKRPWWQRVMPTFCMHMDGRILWDGLGDEPPTAERVMRDLEIWDASTTRTKHYRDITAMVEMIDRMRRKHNANSVCDQES
jgi:hypothetical protein